MENKERLLSAIIETANDPIVGADRFGNIIMWNSAATRTFGYTAEEIMNQPITLLMPPRFAALHEIALERAVSVGQLYYAKRVREVFGRRKDGSEFPVEISISASGPHQEIVFTAIIRDITKRVENEEELRKSYQELESRVAERTAELVQLNENLKQEIEERKRIEEMLRTSERLYHALVEGVPDGIFILNDEGRFNYLNTQAEDLLGRPLREILETPLSDYVISAEREKIESIFRLSPDTIWDEEVKLLSANGEIRFVRIRCKALDSDARDRIHYEGVMRDITLRKRLEEQIKQSQEELLEKIRIIDELYAHVVESRKAKAIAEYTAEVAHELRQPLTIIGGFARRIGKQLDSCNVSTRSGQTDTVQIISSEVRRLESILNNLLDFTRRESVSQQMANPDRIIEKVLNLYQEILLEKELKLDISLQGMGDIPVDPERFEHVVRNLVSNAIDASPFGQVVHVQTRISIPNSKALKTAALESESYFVMKVRSHGPCDQKRRPPKNLQPLFYDQKIRHRNRFDSFQEDC